MTRTVMGWLFLAAFSGGCQAIGDRQAENQNPFQGVTHAIAVIHPTAGNSVHGVVRFEERTDGILWIGIELHGLTPGPHGFHIHELGDCSAQDGASAAGHYNPEGHPHALDDRLLGHAGDFGNVQANAQGDVNIQRAFAANANFISIAGPKDPILGRSVVVHANPDDGSQPAGNAGARVGCGVIGLANPE